MDHHSYNCRGRTSVWSVLCLENGEWAKLNKVSIPSATTSHYKLNMLAIAVRSVILRSLILLCNLTLLSASVCQLPCFRYSRRQCGTHPGLCRDVQGLQVTPRAIYYLASTADVTRRYVVPCFTLRPTNPCELIQVSCITGVSPPCCCILAWLELSLCSLLLAVNISGVATSRFQEVCP